MIGIVYLDTMAPRFFHLSETSAGVQFGNEISPDLNRRVIQAYQYFREHPFPGYVEAVPAYASLVIYYEPMRMPKYLRLDTGLILELFNDLLARAFEQDQQAPEQEKAPLTIPVCYHPILADDLEWTAAHCGVEVDELIRLHTSQTYTVYMLGFVPGFPYLGILPERLTVPRKSRPAESVPAGSVALAGRQTGIYPLATPGGWQVIGRTPLHFFDPRREPVCLLKPGDRVRFESITLHEFLQYPTS
jgi:inhibitor of KinA